MISRNLRHLRVLVSVADTGSVTAAADQCHVSQPAVTQAINKLETETGGPLFERTRQGFFPTPRGKVLLRRVERALALIDPALAAVSPRLKITATTAQLSALIAMRETENFTLAAKRQGLSQPTVHRAISEMEREAQRSLFERTSFGMVATRQAKTLAQAAQLAFTELDQAEAELVDLDGGEAGRLVVGALPLSRSVVLPKALIAFRTQRPTQAITVIDGPYDELLGGLRRGEIDVMIGALRQPAPIGDIVQEPLFDDRMAILAGNHHPLAQRKAMSFADLAGNSWVVPRSGSPAREQFDTYVGSACAPRSVIEAGSILLMREILSGSDHLGCISAAQADAEVSKGLLTRLDVAANWPARQIGLTYRASWSPTAAQELLLDCIRESARHSSMQ